MVQVCFVLDNITTTEDETRKVLYEHCGLLPMLNGVFARYNMQHYMLLDVLLGSSKEAILDCLRVYGNLSRHWKACQVIVQRKGMYIITMYVCLMS